MEPKKNPKYDVHKKSRMIFFFSLCISIVLVLTAFQWKQPFESPTCTFPTPPIVYETTYPIPITEINNTEPPEPEPIKEKPTYLNPVESTETILIDAPSLEPPKELPIAPLEIPYALNKVPVEPDTFFIVEKMPLPKDGYEGFYEFISKETKYPKKALQRETQGKVFVEFVVTKNGTLTNLHVLKGIGSGCDEEALRVISLTKWQAGKQRGVPVNVKMTLPFQFTLQH